MTGLGAALSLMPMHLMLDREGRIVSAGSTLRRLTGLADRMDAVFDATAADLPAMMTAERIFLRLRRPPHLVLRGRAMPTTDGGLLANLGFGIALVEAIRTYGLTDRDFAPADLAMELLFLHEANSAMTDELSRANLRLEEARSKAEAEAFTDPLTGLYNRRGLELGFETLRRGALSTPPQHFALAVMDLDHFKALNDSHGHAAGDEMLRQVAARLHAVTREVDTIARNGGDEFILLMPGLSDLSRIRSLGERIVAAIEQPVEIAGASCRISVSIGVAISQHYPSPSLATMLADADVALYRAKRAGRGCTMIAGDIDTALERLAAG